MSNGSIVGLKDIWSFQSSYYQTIITFLMAINGLIAAVAILYIKSNSEEKAEETTKKYLEGEYFSNLLASRLKEESNDTFRQAQKDFESSAIKLEDALATLERLAKENLTLRQQIRVISQRVATLDRDESSGSEQVLMREES
ncbi:hypothetical protein [Billgrantia endophytica]|uniref:hypothetical protein n=1 Tax=Billgrantia endophytica TaxID=2033802 RepID=UPI0010558413|nr:hypothetical protein [Halomonas endophytica]